jgi:hypothetical protein
LKEKDLADEIGSGTMYDNVAWHAWSPPNFPHTDKEAKASYATEALIHGIGKRVDGHFGDRIKPENTICGKAATEIGKRIVCLQPIDDIAVG